MTPVPRLLIVEDREDDFLLLLHQLERGGFQFDYERVESAGALDTAIAAGGWDLVISDFSLPTLTAHDVLARVTADLPDVPCIVISSTITEEAAVDLLRAGARDFVSKERLTRLIPAIERELREAAERRRQRANEAALREARARLQYVVEAVDIGTWESDLRTGTLTWSPVLERLHGLEPGTFGGTLDAFVALIRPDDRAETVERLRRAHRDRSEHRIEYRAVWPDGSEHWLMGIGRSFADGVGTPTRAAGVVMDITAQKKLEEQVRQAQKMESIGNLAGGVAHDFNNLLTIIAGECELMSARAGADREMAASLEAVKTATISASALTRTLLTFSRRQVVSPKLVRIDEHISRFRDILRRLVEENITLTFRLEAPSAVVRIDPSQIEQVLLNLVANARDAISDGGAVAIATRAVRDASGEWVELSVTDTGAGIPPHVRAHLFEPFFTTKPVGYGTGLGLATVHGIVTEGGGSIDVDSRPGNGTTFRITLPVAQDAGKSSPSEPKPAAAAPVEHRGHAILVIEDNAALRSLTERILCRAGYKVLTAASGDQARQVCRDYPGPIGLLIADVIMPDGSGPSAAEWICQQRPDTKVVYMSGYTADAKQIAGKGDAFLQKPFSMADLVGVVSEVLAC